MLFCEENFKTLISKIIKVYSNYVDWWPYFEDKSEIIISSILAQNTKWENVLKSLHNLKNFVGSLKLERIVSLPLEELKNLIRPSGFYNSKSKTLLNISKYILENYQDFRKAKNYLKSKILNSNSSLVDRLKKVIEFRNEFMKIKGIAKETVDSILLYSMELPSFVVDSYTVRIVNRIFSENFSKVKHYDFIKNYLELVIIKNLRFFTKLSSLIPKYKVKNGLINIFVNLMKVLHAGFVEIGKNFCLKKTTKCKICPLLNYCNYYHSKKCENFSKLV